MSLHVIVLAAGKGVRMKSDRAKVLHEAAGRPLVAWMCDLAASLTPDTTVVVVGHQAAAVEATLPSHTITALQARQDGTGHAAQIGLAATNAGPDDTIVVLPGDMPLVRSETLRSLVEHHTATASAATVLTVRLDDPTGYGRVVRRGERVIRIVEHRDASAAELAVDEVNTSVYAFRAADLASSLEAIDTDNDQGELYLTDAVEILVAAGKSVGAVLADAAEGMGVNTVDQLAAASAELDRRTAITPTAD